MGWGGERLGSGIPPSPADDDWPLQHLHSSILEAWRFSVFAKLSERKGFLGGEYADFKGSLQLLTSSHLRERDIM